MEIVKGMYSSSHRRNDYCIFLLLGLKRVFWSYGGTLQVSSDFRAHFQECHRPQGFFWRILASQILLVTGILWIKARTTLSVKLVAVLQLPYWASPSIDRLGGRISPCAASWRLVITNVPFCGAINHHWLYTLTGKYRKLNTTLWKPDPSINVSGWGVGLSITRNPLPFTRWFKWRIYIAAQATPFVRSLTNWLEEINVCYFGCIYIPL